MSESSTVGSGPGYPQHGGGFVEEAPRPVHGPRGCERGALQPGQGCSGLEGARGRGKKKDREMRGAQASNMKTAGAMTGAAPHSVVEIATPPAPGRQLQRLAKVGKPHNDMLAGTTDKSILVEVSNAILRQEVSSSSAFR